MGELLTRASDPQQYDKDEAGWSSEGTGLQSPTRAHFWEYLFPYTANWRGKNLLDIGSGTGWLLNQALRMGARSAIGVEPSARNLQQAQELYPHVTTIHSTLEEFTIDQRFGIATSLMSLVHIANLDAAFRKIGCLLEPGGEFLTIVPNYDHHRRPRHGYQMKIEEIDSDQYVVAVTRPHGTLVDIIRRINKYTVAAEKSNLRLVEDIPMVPSEKLMEKAPRFRESAGIPMTHLLRFSK